MLNTRILILTTVVASVVVSRPRPACATEALYQEASQADSAYRSARTLLNRGRYEMAAGAFETLRQQYTGAAVLAESFYWEAFARYRLGQSQRALELLERQRAGFPRARTLFEASALRTRICGELAGRGNEECARELAEQSREESGMTEETRMMALNAIVNMRPERAMPILRREVANYERSPEYRQQVMYLIAEKADPGEATELLLESASNDPDTDVRKQAVFWLSEVDSEAAVDGLLSILAESDDSEVLQQAVYALSQQGGRRAMDAVRDLVQRDDVSDDVRSQAVFWLGAEGTAEDVAGLRAIYSEVSGQLKQQILYAVAEAGGSENQAWLLQLALDEDEPIENRKNALYWVAESGASVAQLIEFYDSMTDVEMRQQLIWVLSESDAPTAVDKLLDIARSDSNLTLREQAIFWLGESDDPRAMDFLLELLEQ